MSEKGEDLLNSETDGSKVAELPHMAAGHASVPSDSSTAPSTEQQQQDEDRVRQEEEWRRDLFRLENEMATLRSVLMAKTKESDELKKKLGITPLVEFKEDIRHGFQTIKESEPIQKTSAAFKDFGEFASKKLDNLRNSSAFKSVEEKVGVAYISVKKKISSGKSETDESQEVEAAAEATESNITNAVNKSADDYTPIQP